MSFENDSPPRIYLNDGTANADLPGSTIVYPFRELTPLIALQETVRSRAPGALGSVPRLWNWFGWADDYLDAR